MKACFNATITVSFSNNLLALSRRGTVSMIIFHANLH